MQNLILMDADQKALKRNRKMKKQISICIPCYNEADNVVKITQDIIEIMRDYEGKYEYHIQFIDNCSTDRTKELLRKLCDTYPKVRAIFNAKNFPMTSGYHGLLSAQGDAVIMIPADFQVPVKEIPKLICAWEEGNCVICLQKQSSQEGGFWTIRQMYYRLLNAFSENSILKNFSGYGMYDKKFLDICRQTNTSVPNFMQMIQTHGFAVKIIKFDEQKRQSGHSKNNIWSLINIGLNRFINASAMMPKIMIGLGMGLMAAGLCAAIITIIIYILQKSIFAGILFVLESVFCVGGMILFFMGVMGLYIMKIDQRTLHAPLVAEEERLNFPEDI